jgi:dinuclear metal center YbgI/SA1388 family protein
MKKITGFEFIEKFEQFAPQSLAAEGDPVGLHIGDLSRPIERLLITLDVRPEVVDEAIERNVDFIFAHHPPIFKAIDRLDLSDPQNKMYVKLLEHGITVYAAHTNLDLADGGMNDWLAEALELEEVEIMKPISQNSLLNLGLYVPLEKESDALQRLYEAGAGESDFYSHVSYTNNGMGRFTPRQETLLENQEVDRHESIQVAKIEVSFPDYLKDKILNVISDIFPYEKPAYTLTRDEKNGRIYGYGRVGNLKVPLKFEEFLTFTKEKFDIEGLRYVGEDLEKEVRRVAVMGGDGGKYYKDAKAKGADVFVTGDIYYHTAHDMEAAGLLAVDPGHHIESILKEPMAEYINMWKESENWEIDILTSTVNTDPFYFY